MNAGKEHSSFVKNDQETSHTIQANIKKVSSFSPGERSPLHQSTTETGKSFSFVTPESHNTSKKFYDDHDHDNNNDKINNTAHESVRVKSNNHDNNEITNINILEYENINDPIERTIRTDSANKKIETFAQKINEHDVEMSRRGTNECDCINEENNFEIEEKVTENIEEKEELQLQFLKIIIKKRKNKNGLYSISVNKEILSSISNSSSINLEPFILEFKNLFGTYDGDDSTVDKELMCVLPEVGLLWSWIESSKNVPENVPRSFPKNVPVNPSGIRTGNTKVSN